ncbi:2OG-Fe(II) oxygenase [Chitinimonas sp.]|uniref:2OG-Fe(II) oxygenase n=1 Tax=Chitinimonas sp. TaxID=1934313 RepID=UPI002F95F43A
MTSLATRIPALIDAIAEQGWVVLDDFLSPAAIDALRDEAASRLGAGQFHRAGVGRSEGHAVRDTVRGDSVRWLDAGAPSPAELPYWEAITQLQEALNRELFLGIREGEFHYAHYPVGSFYKRHIDRFRDDDARTVSVVLYLNQDWVVGNGGELRIWTNPDQPAHYVDISPQGGRLVLFLSERFWHEVLPAQQPRWSLTGWMRR